MEEIGACRWRKYLLPALASAAVVMIALESKLVRVNHYYPLLGVVYDGGTGDGTVADDAWDVDGYGYGDIFRRCTDDEWGRQRDSVCGVYTGRHNVEPFWYHVRYHMPDAKYFIDIGANKGLVSARWLNLWKPDLNITSRRYATEVAKPYFERYADVSEGAKRQSNRPCGVTNMCASIPDERMGALPPVPPRDRRPLVVHSIEPSPPIYELHREFLSSSNLSSLSTSSLSSSWYDDVRSSWKWHNLAVSDRAGNVSFATRWDEGSSILRQPGPRQQKDVATVPCTTLDDLVPALFPGDGDAVVVVDVIKIDAENVDARVVAGAAKLLSGGRVRLVTWETPNDFPISVPSWTKTASEEANATDRAAAGDAIPRDDGENGGGDGGGGGSTPFRSFEDFVDRGMWENAGMSCYFPSSRDGDKYTKVTGCGRDFGTIRCRGESILMSNVVCVNPRLAPSLASHMERNSLVY